MLSRSAPVFSSVLITPARDLEAHILKQTASQRKRTRIDLKEAVNSFSKSFELLDLLCCVSDRKSDDFIEVPLFDDDDLPSYELFMQEQQEQHEEKKDSLKKEPDTETEPWYQQIIDALIRTGQVLIGSCKFLLGGVLLLTHGAAAAIIALCFPPASPAVLLGLVGTGTFMLFGGVLCLVQFFK